MTSVYRPPHKIILNNSSRMSVIVDRILCLLEKVSDEAFWQSLVGDRILNLLKRYFGSDVVFLGFIVYLAPIVGYQLHSIFYQLINFVKERMYVSIQIGKNETGYEAIQQFVASKTTTHIQKSLRTVEGRCVQADHDDLQGPGLPPTLRLYPLDETEQKITYKNHTLWVIKRKNSGVSNNMDQFYSNNLKDLLGMMNTNPCVEITMRGQDLSLLKSFIQEWIDDYFEQENGKLTIYKCMPSRYDGFEWRTLTSKQLRDFGSVILKEGQKELILKDIQIFRKREHWYSIRGIPYRRGYLLYGPPGTGKTSLVQSIASKVNMNVAIISLSGKMDDENFNVLLQEVPRNSILVMEDVDHCVIKDPNSNKDNNDSKITMSGLLNALDGVAAQEGSMIFLTCNDVNRIQPALLRPGRIDMKMELGYANKYQINRMFWRFMGKDDIDLGDMEPDEKIPCNNDPNISLLAEKFTDMIPDLYVTPAELQNFFIMNLIDNNNNHSNENDYTYLLDAVPAFLESVKRDREQALDHHAGISASVKNILNNTNNEDESVNSTL
ncbi:P-loop containing nucleoside triphosphate hydrolase protein [Cokeromyces recurvatus]|uniref:P-loop containing nucleoside triphosphate hydrolase protein n=1 Tax=Cokeromyces recurvatus TaxID=90255 RepID=UPI00221F7634|nr:P-loop containing nucleoside triphosphate hydrolase protein [Cokeromyces recurvatus]KAI7903562.1 P-loop containing nucleoside triphosphate hydrolase protein [Cokeromyces recurvatus]